MKDVLEIIIKDEIQNILDLFCACFNIRVVFYSSKGEVLKEGLNRPDSLFCQLIQRKLHGKEKCLAMDEQKRLESVSKKKLLCYRCHAGLVETIAPIFIEDHLIGFAMIGQIRSTKTPLPSLKKEWQKKYDLSKLQSAFYQLPYFPKEKIKHTVELFSILVDYIVSKEMVQVKGHLIIERIMAYVKKNINKKNISVKEAADHVGKSTSTVSHLFKKNLGVSFKHMCIEAKLDKAEEYFRTVPDITIGKVAEKLGYDDQFYFSRIYKKFRKIPPSKYIENYRLLSHK